MPGELDYVSNRICREVIEQKTASVSLREKTLGFRGFGLSLGSKRRNLDDLSSRELATIATELVSDEIGTLEHPGAFVHMTLSMRVFSFPILQGFVGVHSAVHQPFGGFYATGQTTEGLSYLVALFGSLKNFVGYEPEGVNGWTPSDVQGLYNLIESFREPGDPVPSSSYRKMSLSAEREDAHPEHNVLARAATICTLPDLPGQARRVEVLARPFWMRKDVQAPNIGEVYPDRFAVGLVGTPLWASVAYGQEGRLG